MPTACAPRTREVQMRMTKPIARTATLVTDSRAVCRMRACFLAIFHHPLKLCCRCRKLNHNGFGIDGRRSCLYNEANGRKEGGRRVR